MNAKNRKTLNSIFHNPVKSDLPWKEIESLFNALGGEVSEGRGSRVRVALNDVRAVFHRVRILKKLLTKEHFYPYVDF